MKKEHKQMLHLKRGTIGVWFVCFVRLCKVVSWLWKFLMWRTRSVILSVKMGHFMLLMSKGQGNCHNCFAVLAILCKVWMCSLRLLLQ